MSKRKRKQYSKEFILDAVRVMRNRGTRTVADVAESLGVAGNQLYAWHRRYGDQLQDEGLASCDSREDVEALRRRVRQVEQENALLKKAAALFAKEVK